MTFDARAVQAQAEEDYPPFEFVGLDGEDYALPSPMLITTDKARELNEAMVAKSEDELFELLKELWPEDAYNAVMEMSAVVTAQLMDAWKAGIDEAGKSLSPPEPRNRAERRSKPTTSSAASAEKATTRRKKAAA